MNNNEIIENNKTYWNEHAGLWFGTTALPVYGVNRKRIHSAIGYLTPQQKEDEELKKVA